MNSRSTAYGACLVCVAIVAMFSAIFVSAASARASERVLAQSYLPLQGGEIRAPGGWRLYVPPNTLARPGLASITTLGHGKVNVHIAAPWHGEVEVAMPLKGRLDGILHHVGGVWVPEGQGPGQRTVWVTDLSIFSTIKSAVSGVTCLSWNVRAVISCLIAKGISKVDSKLASWIANKISSSCAAALIASGVTGGVGGVALGIFNDPPCVGTASSPGSGPTVPPPSPAPSPTPPPPSPGSPPPPPPPPPPTTHSETTGGLTHTWTNYTNAGGYEGPAIASNQTVLIACKLTGFRVADGNTWWYRIASSPWNSAYYASADAFYNNGQTSGSLIGTPFVDPAVPNC